MERQAGYERHPGGGRVAGSRQPGRKQYRGDGTSKEHVRPPRSPAPTSAMEARCLSCSWLAAAKAAVGEAAAEAPPARSPVSAAALRSSATAASGASGVTACSASDRPYAAARDNVLYEGVRFDDGRQRVLNDGSMAQQDASSRTLHSRNKACESATAAGGLTEGMAGCSTSRVTAWPDTSTSRSAGVAWAMSRSSRSTRRRRSNSTCCCACCACSGPERSSSTAAWGCRWLCSCPEAEVVEPAVGVPGAVAGAWPGPVPSRAACTTMK